MSKVPYLDLPGEFNEIGHEVLPAFERICQSGRFAQGPPTASFEAEFAAYCGVKHCVSVNSGCSALHLALRCLNVGPGDEVITVAMTFIATAWAISYVGARPVFVDIDPTRRTMDPAKLRAAITTRTKAIIPVHLYGMPAEMDAICKIADEAGIPVVEDAAQAHGARYRGKRVGQFGQIACFSFYPGKNLGAYGEGGALLTEDEGVAKRAAALRDHAQSERYFHDEIGYNYRMDSLQGAVLSIKLKRLDAWNALRNQHAITYSQSLAGLSCVTPAFPADSECVWHCYVIECDDRDKIRQRFRDSGIEVGLQYPLPVHLQKAYEYLGHRSGDFPITEALCKRCLSLPIYPGLTEDQLKSVGSVLADALRQADDADPAETTLSTQMS
jgi:dTDP-4-amino-4,6-dideoxygalactose transaminase